MNLEYTLRPLSVSTKGVLKRFQLIILIAVLVAPFILKNGVLIGFYMHQDYIAKELCEQKDVKDSCCKGSCVLQKELQKTESGNEELPKQLTERTEIVFVLSELNFNESEGIGANLLHHSVYQSLMSEQFLSELIHPPAC